MTPPAPTIEPEDYRRLVGFKLLLLAILGAAAYLNSVYGWFPLFQDEQALSHALSAKTWFSPTVVADWLLALNNAISGRNAWSYHALNIVLHVLAALALYGVVCRTLIRLHDRPRLQEAAPWLAFLIALLWLAHPLNTETVDYLSRRGDLLAGLLTFLTLYCVIRGADSERGMVWYGLAVMAFALGTGTAATIAAAPVAVLLYDRIFLAGSWRDLWHRRALLYAGLAACWALLGLSVWGVGYGPQDAFNTPGVTDGDYVLAQPTAILHYLALTFWPPGMAFDYFDWPLTLASTIYILPLIAVLALLAATAWALVRRPKIGFLGAWFFLTLAPTSLLPQADGAGESRMYLPLAAVAALVVLGGFGLVLLARERAPWAVYAAVGVAVLAVAALGFTTFRRNAQYESPLAIWEDTLAKRPDNVRAHFQLGNLYTQANQLDKAVGEYQTVLDAPPLGRNGQLQAPARNNLSWALALRQIADAPDDAERAKRLNDFGFTFWTKDSPAEAAQFFREAVRLQPGTAKYHFNLALALFDAGDLAGAAAERKKGMDIDPDWPKTAREQAWKKATDADPEQRNALQAVFLARQASQGEGGTHADAMDALAAAYAAAGRFAEAAVAAELAIRLADGEHNAELAREIQQRQALYRDRRPFIQKQAER